MILFNWIFCYNYKRVEKCFERKKNEKNAKDFFTTFGIRSVCVQPLLQRQGHMNFLKNMYAVKASTIIKKTCKVIEQRKRCLTYNKHVRFFISP